MERLRVPEAGRVIRDYRRINRGEREREKWRGGELRITLNFLPQLDPSNDENRKINLSPVVARRIFSEQLNEIVGLYSRRKGIRVPLVDVVNLFRNKFGYSMIPQTLGCNTIEEMMRCLPFVEVNKTIEMQFLITYLLFFFRR